VSQPHLSVNREAVKLLRKLLDNIETYGAAVKTKAGTTLIDVGIKAKGGFKAGKIVTEICLGGLGEAKIFPKMYGDIAFPSIFVYTDHPALATLGSQFAGWQIKLGDYFAIGSGPARALALKPKEIYEKIGYKDEAKEAVIVLETSEEPPEEVIAKFSEECNVPMENLYLILVPTASVAGSTQVSGRIVETGIHKLMKLGLDPNLIFHAWGYAPIASVHCKFAEAMGRTNDAILYGGVASYTLSCEDDGWLRELVEKAPSRASKSYGKPFLQIFKEAGYDFYKIDPNLFAPAVLIVNNVKTGSVFQAGEINVEVLRESLGVKL